jgi:hypothetical protein
MGLVEVSAIFGAAIHNSGILDPLLLHYNIIYVLDKIALLTVTSWIFRYPLFASFL